LGICCGSYRAVCHSSASRRCRDFRFQENDPSEEAWRHDFTLRIPAIHAQRPALDVFGKAVPIAAVIASDQRFEYFGTSAFAVRLLQLD
jgi:hypothetical protein